MRSAAARKIAGALLSAGSSHSSRWLQTPTARQLLPPELLSPASQLLQSPWSVIQRRGVKVHGSDVRPGNIIERKGRLYEVVKADHGVQGRGSAVIQVELRDIESGNKVNARLNTSESVEKAFVEEKSFTCMCTIDDEVALIDPNTFEQIDVKRDLFGKNAAYLKEEMKVTLRFFGDKPLSGTVPKRVVCTVKETPPHVKGSTVTPVDKRALLDNGLTVKVPPFIENGEIILVNSVDDSYVSRAKERHANV